MVTDPATALTMVTDRATAMEMATAMADMGLTTSQVDLIVRAVMGDIGHMMGVMVVIAPIKVGTALEALEALEAMEAMEAMAVIIALFDS